MPQMMPINWFFSFFFFIGIFIIFMIMNFYMFNYKIDIKKKNINSLFDKKIFWKW
uniref:ATP synthase complex subunit 8 n=1 Tax=Telchinia polis TaxID=501958 RepID=A0A140CVE8_9NEOP|nr:ATP synthase F0 subunit 8 [Telchinia polis]AMJ17272.1 ATP synthase F0 subunit 8 [Telchinia polis]